MKPVKLSVIASFYNQAEFIPTCVDSVIKQNVRDIELILVNNASTDDTDEIIKRYLKQDNRIVYLKQRSNDGVDAARRAGLEVARGEFVLIMDGDDWYEDGLFEKILAAFETHPDLNIVEFGFYQNKAGVQFPAHYLKRAQKNAVYRVADEDILSATALWNKCYRLAFLRKHGLTAMPFRCDCGSEIPMHICSFLKAESVYFLDFYGYNWRIRSDSTSHDVGRDEKFLAETWVMLDFLKSELKRLNVYREDAYHHYCHTILMWYIREKFSLHKPYRIYYNKCRRLFQKWGCQKLPPYVMYCLKKMM